MSRLTTKTSIMGRKHDLLCGCAKNWKKAERYYLIENAVDKLGTLENLEEELGIDLITLFKALKDGIYVDLGDIIILKPSSDLSLKLYLGKWYIAYYHSLNGKTFYVSLKDFNKTWWLQKPKEND